MSQQLPPPPAELAYASAAPFGNAASLLRLAVIFTYVSAGLDLLGGLIYIGMTIFMYIMFSRLAAMMPPPTATSPAATMPIAFPMTFLVIEYSVLAALCFAAGIAKFICGIKFQRRGSHAWGWGLAAAIVGCTELWCNLACVLPLAAGVFTIVILSRENVRAFLKASPEQRTAYPA